MSLLTGGNYVLQDRAPLGGYLRDGFGEGVKVVTAKHVCTLIRRCGLLALVEREDLSRRWVQVSHMTLIGPGVDPGEAAQAELGLAEWESDGALYPVVVAPAASADDGMLRVIYLEDGTSAEIPRRELRPLPKGGDAVHYDDEQGEPVPAVVIGYPSESQWVVEVGLSRERGKRVLVEVTRVKVTKADRGR